MEAGLYNGKEVNLCIPTLNRYDLLVTCVLSAVSGTVKPTQILIIDNGLKLDRPNIDNLHVYNFGRNIGLAASWNFLIKNTNEYRIIVNDDIEFFPDTIEKLINSYDENYVVFPGAVMAVNTFSCFMISNKIIDNVGFFDENISPGYAYFEDNDYRYRMHLAGFETKRAVECGLIHRSSSTIKKFNHPQINIHHKLFEKAKNNYINKWGGLPENEKYLTPYNK